MRPLRILHVTPYSAGAWAYGGIPRLTAALTTNLSRRGHDVTVCTTDACDASVRLSSSSTSSTSSGSSGSFGASRRRFTAWPPSRTTDGLVERVFPNVSNRAAYHWQAFAPIGLDRYLRRHAASFDVAHVHACRNLPGVIAARRLHRAGVPMLVAPNGTAPLLERRLLAKRTFDLTLGRRLLQDAACVLAVSAAEVRQFAAIGVPARSVRLIPNAIDLDEFAAPIARGRFRQRHQLGSAPVVLFLGKLTPRKRVDVLIRAFAAAGRADAQLVIAGNDMGSGSSARALARSVAIEARTVFTGLLEGADRLEALADADVVVYPSQDEIFGLVPLEALLAGTPVIVADDSGCGELIGGIGGGHVVPLGDVAALASAICRVLDAPVAHRDAATRAAVQVRSRFGAEAVGAQMIDLYRELISTGTRG